MSHAQDADLLVEMSERLGAMRTREVSHYAVPDYLSEEWQAKLWRDVTTRRDGDEESARVVAASSAPHSSPSASSADGDDDGSRSASASSSQINEFLREKICEWCYQVVDHYDFNREIVAVAMSFLDRYLATVAVSSRRIFQLAAMTALYLAVKLHEPVRLHVSSLVQLSRGHFAAEHVATMERHMLQTLCWDVHPPTPVAFCRDLSRLVSGDVDPLVWDGVNELARFLTELSVGDYWFVTKRPSSIALASVVGAMELQGPQRFDPNHKTDFLHRAIDVGMGLANGEVIECYERLRELYIVGGYAPNQESAGEEGSPVADVDPAREVDEEAKGAGVPRVVVTRAASPVSPSAVIPESPSVSGKRKTGTSVQRCTQAKRTRKNSNRELNEKEGNL